MQNTVQPKYKILQKWIKDRISSGEFQEGQQIPTELELSSQFGFSRQTVRQAINALEQEGTLSRTRGRGTFVCDCSKETSDSTEKTYRIGVVTTYVDDYVFPGIIEGIEQTLTQNGYLLNLAVTRNKTIQEETILKKLLTSGIDGLIIEGTKSALPSPNAKLLQTFRDKRIPLVFINGYYNDIDDSYVIMDDIQAGEMLVDILLKNGHNKIGAIFKSDDMQGIKRYEGVVKALQDAGNHIQDENVLWYTTEDLPYLFDGEKNDYVLSRLLNVSAVVCYNDEIAANLIRLMKNGDKKAIKDLSIVSFDDSPLAATNAYNLTSAIYPAKQIGETAANILLRCLEKKGHKERIKIESGIIERGSVYPLK